MAAKLNKPRILGVLAGGDLPLDRLSLWLHSADIILAADGGADFMNSLGFQPDVAIGDFDSISISTKERLPELIHIPDQSSTDCDKLLSLAAERGFTDITLIAAEGDLLDHFLGTLHSSARSSLQVRLVLRRGVAHVLRGPCEANFEVPEATRLSLMPLTECRGVDLEGVVWPLAGAKLSPVGLTSISNQADGPVKVAMDGGVAVLFLSHPDLEPPHWGL